MSDSCSCSLSNIIVSILIFNYSSLARGRHGRDHMVVGFTTTYAISVYHHWCCEFESSSGRDVQHYVIKFVSDFCQWFSPGPSVSSTNKTDRHDITEILLKMALNTIKQTNKSLARIFLHFHHHFYTLIFMLSAIDGSYSH